ncbi:MAG: hypothetical protein ACOYVJ_12090 [Nitrospirota bacterium]
MGYTQVALEDKILQMFPEIQDQGIRPELRFDEEKGAWYVKLKKNSREATVCLVREDADACMDNTYCQSFGDEVRKALNDLKAA